MSIARTILVLLLLGAAGPGIADDVPEFSGTWELNTQKGENLGMVAAIKETVVISQSDEQLVIDFADVFQGKTMTRKVIYDLSGTPVVNYAAMGDRNDTVSSWEDAALVTTWTSEGAIAGTVVVRTETRTLSPDGQTMTVSSGREGAPAMVLVYEKQE